MSLPSENQGLQLGPLIIEGKTKQVYNITGEPYGKAHVLIVSKDRITAGDGARAHDLAGKARISNETACKVFQFLNSVGIKTHFINGHKENSFIARNCEMVPIEWVTRRIATGSFLKRYPGVPEGYRFAPLKLETFFKDDANHDPQWSEEQLLSAKLQIGQVRIGRSEVEIMKKTTVCVFEILEKGWASLNCVLVDMKVEFGIDLETGEILLADIVDSDSWRLWPSGDKRLMKDKQVYRNLQEVTNEDLQRVKQNFAWVAERLNEFIIPVNGRAVVLMGSSIDVAVGRKVQSLTNEFGIHCELRVTSAHKGPSETLKILAEYESDGVPTVFVAIAGRSNGLGPVAAGNTTYPVINCPPLAADWGVQDIWSSLRLPSGLGCTTALSPETAAYQVAQIFGLANHAVWSRIRSRQLNMAVSLINEDSKLNLQL
ncbi:hypothetical protein CHUAL_001550 [Chamberlinius hualienensis]